MGIHPGWGPNPRNVVKLMPKSNESELEIKYKPCKYEFGANKIRSMRSEIRINWDVVGRVRSCWGKEASASNDFEPKGRIYRGESDNSGDR